MAGGGRDTDNGQQLGLRQACGPSVLTRNSFLVADALVEAAPKFFAPVPGDVIVTDVIERDVTHCKAQTSADLAGNMMEGDGAAAGVGGKRGESARLTDVSLLLLFIMQISL